MSDTNIRSFVDGLQATGLPPPALVIVDDYRHRAELAGALRDEADIHGVSLQEFSTLEVLQARLPELSAKKRHGALVLVDTEEGSRWGKWLEANRERLPDLFALTLVLIMSDELPRLVRAAPSFFSWAKGQLVQGQELTEPTQGADVLDAALEEMHQATGLTPEQFVQAWQQGQLPDTHRNSAWINLAKAWLAGRDS